MSIVVYESRQREAETDEACSMIAACHTATSYFNLWLKAEGYSVSKINYLPTGGNALAIVVTLAWGMIADRTGQFYWLIISLQFLMILSNILLSVWTIPKSALLFAYYISYAGSAATPVLIVSRQLPAPVSNCPSSLKIVRRPGLSS